MIDLECQRLTNRPVFKQNARVENDSVVFDTIDERMKGLKAIHTDPRNATN